MSAYTIQSVNHLGGCHLLGYPPPLGLRGCTPGLHGCLRLSTRAVRLLFLGWWLWDSVVPLVAIYSKLLKTQSVYIQKFQHLIDGTLSSGDFLKSLAIKRQALGTYFVSSFIDQ